MSDEDDCVYSHFDMRPKSITKYRTKNICYDCSKVPRDPMVKYKIESEDAGEVFVLICNPCAKKRDKKKVRR